MQLHELYKKIFHPHFKLKKWQIYNKVKWMKQNSVDYGIVIFFTSENLGVFSEQLNTKNSKPNSFLQLKRIYSNIQKAHSPPFN